MRRIKYVRIIFISLSLITTIIFYSCGSNLPEDKEIGDRTYTLINQDSTKITFPDYYKGKTLVLGFIYTNCPDICPMTVHNMQRVKEQIDKANIDNVEYAAISFDPERDTPAVLKEYGRIRDIDFKDFQFYTGNQSVIDTLIDHLGVFAMPGDTTVMEGGDTLYFYTHTDRITLLDENGHIRNEYGGSRANVKMIVNDIKELE